MEMRESVIDAISAFIAKDGKLVVVCRGREDDDEPDQMPWPLSRRDLSRFEANGLKQLDFAVMRSLEPDDEMPRFIVEYQRIS